MTRKLLFVAISTAIAVPFSAFAVDKTCATPTANYYNLPDVGTFNYTNECKFHTVSTDDVAGGATLNSSWGDVTFDKPVTITYDQNVNGYDYGSKGIVTVGAKNGKNKITFADDLTIDYKNAAQDLKNTRLTVNRHAPAGIEMNGKNNVLTLESYQEPTDNTPAGAALENYGLFTIGNPDGMTTLNATGKVNGLAQYGGTLTVNQALTINTDISDAVIAGENTAALLLSAGFDQAGGTAISVDASKLRSKGAFFNNDVTINAKGKGAGLATISQRAYNGFFTFSTGNQRTRSGNKTITADFKKDLTINTTDGAGILFQSGNINHTGDNATITSQNSHGIEVVGNNAAGKLSPKDTAKPAGKSEANVITLASGAGLFTESLVGDNIFAVDLGEKATVTSGKDGIHVNSGFPDDLKDIRIANAGTITAAGHGITLESLNADPALSGKKDELDKIHTITVKNTGTIAAGDHAYFGNDFNETFTSTGGTLAGKFKFKDGWDNVSFENTDLQGVTVLDGGLDTDPSNEFDTLTFGKGLTMPSNGFAATNLINWEKILVKDGADLTVTGGADWLVGQAGAGGSGLFIENGGRFSPKDNVKLKGNVDNKGAINLRDDRAGVFNTLTIDGDYEGGGTLLVNTALGDDNSATDRLEIKGTVTGAPTSVEVANKKGNGAATVNGIPIIQLANTPADNKAFTLAKVVEAGAFEYNQLAYDDSSKSFNLLSQLKPVITPPPSTSTPSEPTKPKKPTPTPAEPETPADPVEPSEPSKPSIAQPLPPSVPPVSTPPEIFRPAVSGYTMAQQANASAVQSFLGNHLHQRVGEQETFRWNGDDQNRVHQVWGRIRGESLRLRGKRQFSLDQQTETLQLGWDLDINRDDKNSRQHSGVFAAYAHTDSDLFDKTRSWIGQSTFTGSMRGNVFGLGAYHTRYDDKGGYVDLIGDVHFVRNHYQDVYGGNSKQKGWGFSASIEGGKPYPIGDSEHWFVEPQAELTYQMTRYENFDDGITNIGHYTHQSLRPRLGVRVGYNDKATKEGERSQDIYATASVLHEVLSPAEVTIGGFGVREKVGKDTWLELGIGGQTPIGKSAYVYGSAQYLHTFDTNARRGITGQIGVRYSW